MTIMERKKITNEKKHLETLFLLHLFFSQPIAKHGQVLNSEVEL